MPQERGGLIETRGQSFLAVARRKLAETRAGLRWNIGHGFARCGL